MVLAHFLCGRGADSSFEANIACEHAELVYNQKLCDQFTSKCLGLSHWSEYTMWERGLRRQDDSVVDLPLRFSDCWTFVNIITPLTSS